MNITPIDDWGKLPTDEDRARWAAHYAEAAREATSRAHELAATVAAMQATMTPAEALDILAGAVAELHTRGEQADELAALNVLRAALSMPVDATTEPGDDSRTG